MRARLILCIYRTDGGEARRLGPARSYVPICSVLPLHDVTLGGKLLRWSRYPAVLFPMDAGRLCPEPEERDKIVAFDGGSETFRRIARPPTRRGCYPGEALFLLKADDDRMLAMADFLRGSMDLWVLEDYEDDASWALRLRVGLPSPLRHACWAVMSPRIGHDVILLGDHRRSWVGLYDVEEKRVLKQIRFVAADDRRTCFNVFVFRESLERHAFFDLLDARQSSS
ncbi:hypothetical protein HU200_019217 [Digitaria exilis]|uniref:F-box associated domain-containing protein n=1 Tax=Digitaria exilis TaxID=1010633 RepID=A0A835KEF9_9POAL|nr:hypothetical protein HU200_019217 [Digitaria exilis]